MSCIETQWHRQTVVALIAHPDSRGGSRVQYLSVPHAIDKHHFHRLHPQSSTMSLLDHLLPCLLKFFTDLSSHFRRHATTHICHSLLECHPLDRSRELRPVDRVYRHIRHAGQRSKRPVAQQVIVPQQIVETAVVEQKHHKRSDRCTPLDALSWLTDDVAACRKLVAIVERAGYLQFACIGGNKYGGYLASDIDTDHTIATLHHLSRHACRHQLAGDKFSKILTQCDIAFTLRKKPAFGSAPELFTLLMSSKLH